MKHLREIAEIPNNQSKIRSAGEQAFFDMHTQKEYNNPAVKIKQKNLQRVDYKGIKELAVDALNQHTSSQAPAQYSAAIINATEESVCNNSKKDKKCPVHGMKDCSMNEELSKGDIVHAGMKTKGGSGFKGPIRKLTKDHAFVAIGTDQHGDRLVKAHIKDLHKEEAEFISSKQIDELSKNTLGSYIKKADTDAAKQTRIAKLAIKFTRLAPDKDTRVAGQIAADKHEKKTEKRIKGINSAEDKIFGYAKINVQEKTQ